MSHENEVANEMIMLSDFNIMKGRRMSLKRRGVANEENRDEEGKYVISCRNVIIMWRQGDMAEENI
jgi:hypothetical protein